MRTTWLLDANLLIAMTCAGHVHHALAHTWFRTLPNRRWATCALTQLAFIRLSGHPRVTGGTSVSVAQAMQALEELTSHSDHEFWNDAPQPLHLTSFASPALVGHRQVTDAYLLEMAHSRNQRLATLDRDTAAFAAEVGLDGSVEWIGSPVTIQEPRARYVRRMRMPLN
jgi:uncharacterized protein